MSDSEISKHAKALSERGAAKGGRARARSLTEEERSEGARKAALARWNKDGGNSVELRATEKLPWAVAEGELVFLDRTIPCAVLDNGVRVLTQQGVLTALGRSRAAKGGEGASRGGLPAILKVRNLAPFISDEVRGATQLIVYKPIHGGYSGGYGFPVAFGCAVEAIPQICKVYINADNAGALTSSQKHVADAARRLADALERVAMVALVDEATGYQAIRANNELQRILEAYVLPEHRPWVRAVPVEFTKELYRLWGWDLRTDHGYRGPRYAGKLIRKYIYEQLPKGVLAKLDDANPPNAKWQRPRKHHQHLTSEVGLEHFKSQLAGVMALMRASANRQEFERLFLRAYGHEIQGEFDMGLLDQP